MTARKRFFPVFLFLFTLLLLTAAACGSTEEVPDPPVTRIDVPDTLPPDEPSHPVTRPPETSDGTTEAPSTTTPPVIPSDPVEAMAQKLLKGMTLEEKVGQMFFVRAETKEDWAKAQIKNCHVGGLVLFAAHFSGRTPAEAKAFCDALQSASDLPLLLAADEEGGTVVRVSKYKAYRATPFLSPRELMWSGGTDLVESDAKERAKLFKSVGLNVNLAPVADVSNVENDFIYERSAGSVETVCEYVKAFVSATEGAGVGTVLKHFPGYGSNADTHTGVAVDRRAYGVFEAVDFLPFREGLDAGSGIVMVSHNIVTSMDAERPASLSPEVHRVLREELGFEGLIMTDDLYMDAIREYAEDGECAVMAVEAGNDLICASDLDVKYKALVKAVQDGEIPVSRIDESVLRILRYKINLGLIRK